MPPRPFVFTYAGPRGPVVKRFADSFGLTGYLISWVSITGKSVLWVTPFQARGAL